MRDPQQELFTLLKLNIEELGYDVYDGALPPENTPYPFVYLGDNQMVDQFTKSAVIGTVYQTIHVWSNDAKKRGTLSQMLVNIKHMCHLLQKGNYYSWHCRNVDQQIIPDNTTKIPLLHGVIDVEFRFS